MVLDKNDKFTGEILDIGEASRRLSSSGLAKHLGFFNPKGTTANAKDYQKYETESDNSTEE